MILAKRHTQPRWPEPLYSPPLTRVGYVAPTVTYEKMRQMQASASALDRDIHQHVADAAFRDAWDAWYRSAWLPFFEKYAGPDSSSWAKLNAALWLNDEVTAQAESYRLQLENFYRTYPQQKTPDGTRVPTPRGASPILPGLPTKPRGSYSDVPWWVWALGASAVGGLGYLGYLKVRALQAKARRSGKHGKR